MPARPSHRSLVSLGLLVVALFGLASATTWASDATATSSGSSHEDPVAPVLLALTVVLVAAKLGGDLATRVRQPSVLGELVVGVLIGNLSLVGLGQLEYLKSDQALDLLSRLGVLILLFEVGLESTVGQMLKVGGSALLVAVLGVIAPFFLGWGVSAWLLPPPRTLGAPFIGATLAATSVGITARVLKDLGRLQARESKIVLGAAVIDDVMGLVILAVVVGMISAVNSGEAMALGGIFWIIGKAVPSWW